MTAYILRRLLWMVPTFIGILIINFVVLRLQGLSLAEQAGQADEHGERDAEQAQGNIETHLKRAYRTGNNRPAVLNLRGFADVAEVLELLRATERGAGISDTATMRAESRLWIGGRYYVEPLAKILGDEELHEFHGPASRALTLCMYIPLNVEDLGRYGDRVGAIRLRNQRLSGLILQYRNDQDSGYATPATEENARKRAALLAMYEAHAEEYRVGFGDKLVATVVDTGFTHFMTQLLTGNLYSEKRREYVFTLIADVWHRTFFLNLVSVMIAWGCAIPIGIRAARRDGSLEERATTNGLFLLWSMPNFFVGTLLLHHLCTDATGAVRLFPSGGLGSEGNVWYSWPRYLLDLLYHAFLPLVVLCYSSFTALSRYMRANLLEQLGSDYVRTARAKGCDEDRVVYGHATRNSMITMITLGAGLLGTLFGSSVIVELIFSISGLGRLLLDAALQTDAPLVMGSTIISVLLMLFGILLADILYAVVDPRIRSQYV